MNARMTRTFGAVAATAALTFALTACSQAEDAANSAGDAASNATAAVGSAAAGATSAVGGAVSSMTGGASAPDAPPAPVVPSTSISTEGGTEVSITDAPIIEEYAKYGYEKGHLGAPLGPVSPLPDGEGKYLTLKGGTIYWSEATGAHVVHGEIGKKWGEEGFEAGRLGYPTADEAAEDGGITQTFQNGSITFKDGKVTVS